MKHPAACVLAASLFAAALGAGCADSQEPPPPDEQTRLAGAYAELTLLSESARLGKMPDTTRPYQAQADSILGFYDFTKEEFEAAFREVSMDPDRSRQLFDSASAHIQRRRTTGAAPR